VPKKTCGSNSNKDSRGESKEPLRLEGKIRTILKTGRSAQRPLLEAEGAVCVSLVSELRKASFLSVAGRRKIHHATEKKR
jgi:hypothetical protein